MKRKNKNPVWILLLMLPLLPACADDESDEGDDGDDDSGNDDDDTNETDDDTAGDDDDSIADDDDTSGMDDDTDSDDDTSDIWTDSLSGLTWQVTPPSDGMGWGEAKDYCENLSLDGGGWHLPTLSELRTLIRGCDATETGGLCNATDGCLDMDIRCNGESCEGCSDGGGPAGGCYWPSQINGECRWYWSSSPVVTDGGYWWHVGFSSGYIYPNNVDSGSDSDGVRCVRTDGGADDDADDTWIDSSSGLT